MTDKPVLTTFGNPTPLDIQKYKRYLPTAFDESLSLLEKINKVIDSENNVIDVMGDVVTQVNAVQTWALGDGLQQDVNNKLDTMANDGTLSNIINVGMIGTLSDLKTTHKDNLVNAVNDNHYQVTESTGYGVINGLNVTTQATPNMSVLIPAGIIHLANGNRYDLTQINSLAITTADATQNRTDIVYVSGDGVVTYLAGALGSGVPATPTDGFKLAEITVNAGVTSITSSDIKDTRLIKLNNNALETQIKDISYSLKNPPPPLMAVKADGSDETTKIQAIFDTGMKIDIPEGTYGINSTLIFRLANSGQIITGVNAEKVIFKPTANVSVAFKLDGTPDNNSMTDFEFSNFTVDMANMSDLTTSIAIEQIKAWGGKFKNVRAINDGTNKRTFSFKAGSYTTIIENCKGNVIELIGNTLSDAVTTLTFIGCDFEQMYARYAISTTVLQPIVQNSRDKFDIDYVDGFTVMGGDIEGTGVYLKLGGNVNFLYSASNTFVGFTGTYMTGTPLDRSYLHDQYQVDVQLFKQNFKIFEGIINLVKSTAGLFRHIFQGTGNSQVDIQFTNGVGSNYVGIGSNGDAIIDARATGAFEVQSNGASKFRVESNGKLTLTAPTATTATAGTNGDVPLQVAGYYTINIGGTDFKVPYYMI